MSDGVRGRKIKRRAVKKCEGGELFQIGWPGKASVPRWHRSRDLKE